jgi:hypothetical protein
MNWSFIRGSAPALAILGLGIFIGRLSVPRPDAHLADASPENRAVNDLALARGASQAGRMSSGASPQSDVGETNVWNNSHWDRLVAMPRTPAGVRAMTAMLESLATVDPERAMALAQAENNLKLKDGLIQASLRGWAKLSPTNAANYALSLADANAREAAIASVFTGCVAKNPDEAIRLGKNLFQQHPEEAVGYGSRLIDSLCIAGHFDAATQLARDGDPQQRSFWIAGAYSRWAEFQPEQAAAAAAAVSDPDLRKEALHGIVGGWAEADPLALVRFTENLPTENRGEILGQALQYWVRHDPETAAQWINNHDSGPEFDQGIATVATTEAVAPKVAIDWADSIVNPQLRSETLQLVLRNWLTSDFASAKKFFDGTSHLLPEQRQELAEVISGLNQTASQ